MKNTIGVLENRLYTTVLVEFMPDTASESHAKGVVTKALRPYKAYDVKTLDKVFEANLTADLNDVLYQDISFLKDYEYILTTEWSPEIRECQWKLITIDEITQEVYEPRELKFEIGESYVITDADEIEFINGIFKGYLEDATKLSLKHYERKEVVGSV